MFQLQRVRRPQTPSVPDMTTYAAAFLACRQQQVPRAGNPPWPHASRRPFACIPQISVPEPQRGNGIGSPVTYKQCSVRRKAGAAGIVFPGCPGAGYGVLHRPSGISTAQQRHRIAVFQNDRGQIPRQEYDLPGAAARGKRNALRVAPWLPVIQPAEKDAVRAQIRPDEGIPIRASPRPSGRGLRVPETPAKAHVPPAPSKTHPHCRSSSRVRRPQRCADGTAPYPAPRTVRRSVNQTVRQRAAVQRLLPACSQPA